jgi:hypothetical protein
LEDNSAVAAFIAACPPDRLSASSSSFDPLFFSRHVDRVGPGIGVAKARQKLLSANLAKAQKISLL